MARPRAFVDSVGAAQDAFHACFCPHPLSPSPSPLPVIQKLDFIGIIIIIIIIIIILIVIIIMYIYHVLINALSAHMIHINLNMIFYTHVEHSPTKTIYIKHTHSHQRNNFCDVSSVRFGSVQFSSVQEGIYAPGKAHVWSIRSIRGFPNAGLETVPMFV